MMLGEEGGARGQTNYSVREVGQGEKGEFRGSGAWLKNCWMWPPNQEKSKRKVARQSTGKMSYPQILQMAPMATCSFGSSDTP